MKKITEHVYAWKGSVWGGVLRKDGHALLIDAPEFPERPLLKENLEGILLTQHRRPYSSGVSYWNAPVWVSEEEAALLQNADRVWTTGHGKYHRYECIPDRFSPFESVCAERILQDGEVISWRGLTITVIKFSALSNGDCAYLVEDGNQKVLFCGGLAMAGGKIRELYSFQKALPDMMGYHGYLAGLVDWCKGMARVKELTPDVMVPAYGEAEENPAECLDLLEKRLRSYADAYVKGSAVRYYFPKEFHKGFEVPMGMTEPPYTSVLGVHPAWLRRIGETTSYLLTAPSGKAILIDTGDREAIDYVLQAKAEGSITHLDACWITHAHDDHLNTAWMLVHEFDCDLVTTAAVAEVCSQPAAWFLPALPDCNLKFKVLEDGTGWDWEGFRLTVMHLPGQCIAHAGLLVEKDGEKVLLCGDSFAPTGLDDYCAENRNLTGKDRGYDLCVKLLRKYDVHQLVNQHQSDPFIYDEAYLTHLETTMAEREACLADLLPSDVGFGVDPQWLRAWPMEQTVTEGAPMRISAQVTSHGDHTIRICPVIPWLDAHPEAVVHTHGLSSGTVMEGSEQCPADSWVHFDLTAPGKGTYQIPYEAWLDGDYMGSYTNCIVQVI